ncbi:hypothetical protein V2O64_02570 [Verrucomicrobiaceae bacterium 227]
MNPFLPTAPPDLGPDHTRRHRAECGERFYHACLELSQSLWIQGKPAQAILQLNKASMVTSIPAPYQALFWFLTHRIEGYFLGNPVRHFQHLASRMSGENAEIRAWRAWACFHLALEALPEDHFPMDLDQMKEEGLKIPAVTEVLKNIPKVDSSSLPAGSLLARTASVSAHSSTG